ncbi:acetylornithine deacetylase [uncultured Rothia sp.]|uniref:acetylornithine deacetylase n=1 Tax=uncultured Rothia sp. TaxID=316088 RepID=UPI003217B386
MNELPASLPWIERLVAFPTIAETPNAELLKIVGAEFKKFGFEPAFTFSDDGERANLFVTIPALDGSADGGLVLSGHTDVVPVQGQAWDTDPFVATVKGGKLFGRGVADMKSFIACALWMLPEFARAELKKPLHFAFTYDEEIGCVGAPRMIEEFRARGIKPAFAIVGEPSSMQVIAAHKGAHRGVAKFHGVAKHGSLASHGVNASAAAAEFVVFLEELADRWLEKGPFDKGFVTPSSTIGGNFIKAGLQYNIVGEDAVVEYDFRTIPEVSTASVVQKIEAQLFEVILPKLQWRAERAEKISGAEPDSLKSQVKISNELLAVVPPLDTPEGDEILTLGAELIGAPESVNNPLVKVTYGTEGGQFQRAGIPTIVLGPGDIAQAHTANEWIELSQIEECERFMERVLEWAKA